MCWVLVTKLLPVIFQEIHKVRMFTTNLGNIKNKSAGANGLFLYVALKELRVLREFVSHNYRCHQMYNQFIMMHLLKNLSHVWLTRRGLTVLGVTYSDSQGLRPHRGTITRPVLTSWRLWWAPFALILTCRCWVFLLYLLFSASILWSGQ
jgi:hypothetical protein